MSIAAVASLALTFEPDRASSTTSAGVQLPPDVHYRETVQSLLVHRGDRLKSLTLSGPDGTVRLKRAAGRSGFPVAYLNPLGVAETARALMGIDESIYVSEMRLAQGSDGRLVWRLNGRRDDIGSWAAEIAPNGTGLRTIKRAPH